MISGAVAKGNGESLLSVDAILLGVFGWLDGICVGYILLCRLFREMSPIFCLGVWKM